MAAFEYEALDSAGRRLRGVVSADTPRLARRELRRKKLFPVHVAPTSQKKQASAALPKWLRSGLSAKDVSLLTRQLATLVSAAAPVEEALQTMALQTEKQAAKRVLLSVRARVMEGYRLSEALAEESATFSPLYRSMVAAGETSGNLGPVLERLADHLEKSQRLRSKVTTALTYPIFLAVVATAVAAALVTFVVPKVVDQFSSLGQDLPALTELLIAVSAFAADYGLAVAAILALAVVVFLRALKHEGFRIRVDRAVLKVPFVGRLVREIHAARLARTLETLIASGATVLDGLNAARSVMHNRILKDAVAEAATLVSEGASLSAALRRSKAFPPLVTYMAASGENSGRLDHMLSKAADYLEREFEDVTTATLSLLEPAIIIVMGGVVATIVLAILLPILQLNTLALF